MTPVRTLVVWFPGWPATDRGARAFEAVAAAVEALTPMLEVLHPGTLALPTRGPSRFAGGDAALAERAAALAGAGTSEGGARPQVGVADGLFAAVLAARRGALVEPGGSAAFLAPLPVAALACAVPVAPGASTEGTALAELAGLLRRLGLRTLGDVAALPPADLAARFGAAGARASRLARGLDERPPRPRDPPPELAVAAEIEPPAERVDRAAFVARALAVELAGRLARRGLACGRVRIEAETEHGETLARRWRTEGLALETALAERARWQLEGWLDGAHAARPTGGVAVLRLVPEDVVADRGRQLGFWGGATAADERAARGMARISGLLGPEAVVRPRRRGGRGPGEQIALEPWGGLLAPVAGGDARAHPTLAPEPRGGRPAAGARSQRAEAPEAPWPGRLPAPSPALIHAEAPSAELADRAGRPVGVTGRGTATSAPGRLSVGGGPWAEVTAWAGPWPVEERWWDPSRRRRRARLQVVVAGGSAHLLALEAGRWTVEATYD